MQDTSALEYSLAATVCLEPKRVLQLRQIVSVEDFSISACAILCYSSADSTGYCTLWRAYMGKRRVDQIMRSSTLICAHSGAPSFRKARVRAQRS